MRQYSYFPFFSIYLTYHLRRKGRRKLYKVDEVPEVPSSPQTSSVEDNSRVCSLVSRKFMHLSEALPVEYESDFPAFFRSFLFGLNFSYTRLDTVPSCGSDAHRSSHKGCEGIGSLGIQ